MKSFLFVSATLLWLSGTNVFCCTQENSGQENAIKALNKLDKPTKDRLGIVLWDSGESDVVCVYATKGALTENQLKREISLLLPFLRTEQLQLIIVRKGGPPITYLYQPGLLPPNASQSSSARYERRPVRVTMRPPTVSRVRIILPTEPAAWRAYEVLNLIRSEMEYEFAKFNIVRIENPYSPQDICRIYVRRPHSEAPEIRNEYLARSKDFVEQLLRSRRIAEDVINNISFVFDLQP